uniref:Uncharacterized protein n=1 Tax=Podoviridae sp. ct4s49 TaxID=2823555 RepID=A0A8S5LEG6_9CAUD|nr:MAG TPA: hypothetical protein [Podoviridae sp. ct4s49]
MITILSITQHPNIGTLRHPQTANFEARWAPVLTRSGNSPYCLSQH